MSNQKYKNDFDDLKNEEEQKRVADVEKTTNENSEKPIWAQQGYQSLKDYQHAILSGLDAISPVKKNWHKG